MYNKVKKRKGLIDMAKKITWGIVLTVCSVLLVWIGISFMEVQAQNDIGPRNYSDWNAFSIIIDISENRC